MIYLLDANAFMEAARLYYAFDLAPGFWNWLSGPTCRGRVVSAEAIRAEIAAGHGDLVTWAEQLPANFWLADSESSLAHMGQLIQWASAADRPYSQAAVAEFASSADARLIALAMATHGIVATREVPQPRSQRSVKIPDVCAAFSVPCETPFSAYRRLGLKLS